MAAGRSSSPCCRVSPSPVAARPRRSGAYPFRAWLTVDQRWASCCSGEPSEHSDCHRSELPGDLAKLALLASSPHSPARRSPWVSAITTATVEPPNPKWFPGQCLASGPQLSIRDALLQKKIPDAYYQQQLGSSLGTLLGVWKHRRAYPTKYAWLWMVWRQIGTSGQLQAGA